MPGTQHPQVLTWPSPGWTLAPCVGAHRVWQGCLLLALLLLFCFCWFTELRGWEADGKGSPMKTRKTPDAKSDRETQILPWSSKPPPLPCCCVHFPQQRCPYGISGRVMPCRGRIDQPSSGRATVSAQGRRRNRLHQGQMSAGWVSAAHLRVCGSGPQADCPGGSRYPAGRGSWAPGQQL